MKYGNQINVTSGNDIDLSVLLTRDGEHFPVALAYNLKVCAISPIGGRIGLEYTLDEETGRLLVTILARQVTQRVYGLEVSGMLNGSQWRSYYDSLIRYTPATSPAPQEHVQQEGDRFDIVMDVQMYKGMSDEKLQSMIDAHNSDEESHRAQFAAMKRLIDLEKVLPVTYESLVQLRDEGRMLPGQWYRITDYVTTTTQADTQSAGHPFDILVMASKPDLLLETAFAAVHEGDTYFQSSKLEAWELNYCLDNDTDRFAWADPVNGKGVVYRMKDEWANDLPYDFKNIMFKRSYAEPEQFGGDGAYIAIPGSTVELPMQDDNDFVFFFTFSCLASLDEDLAEHPAQADASMGFFKSENEMSADYDDSPCPASNFIEPHFISQSIDDQPLKRVMALPNITIGQYYKDAYCYRTMGNHFGTNCHDLSLIGKNCRGNNFVEVHDSYIIGDCQCSSFRNVRNSSFGYVDTCSFGNVWSSSFGDVRYSSFGYVNLSSFGGVYNSSFGEVYYSSFGYVESSSFGYVGASSFGNVDGSSFGYVERSSFGDCNNVHATSNVINIRVSSPINDVEFIGCTMSNTTTVAINSHSGILFVAKDSHGNIVKWNPADNI